MDRPLGLLQALMIEKSEVDAINQVNQAKRPWKPVAEKTFTAVTF
jgi:hypothetical protein